MRGLIKINQRQGARIRIVTIRAAIDAALHPPAIVEPVRHFRLGRAISGAKQQGQKQIDHGGIYRKGDGRTKAMPGSIADLGT